MTDEENPLLKVFGLSTEEQRLVPEANNVLEQLKDANAVITITSPLDEDIRTISITHTRDVANDTDTYTGENPEVKKVEVGWIIPLENEGKPVLIVIDQNFNASVHFITESSIATYRQSYADKYSVGKTINIDKEDTPHIHSDGVHISYEDNSKRLVPTNPDHLVEISLWLGKGLAQAKEDVIKSIEASTQNRASVLKALADLGKEISSPTTTPAEPQ